MPARARARRPYAPLPAGIPTVLAPASPLPLDFDSRAYEWAQVLADIDVPRRRSGLAHAAPAALGLPQLISTGVCGRWGNDVAQPQAPPWVLSRTRKTADDYKREEAEQRAWERLGVAGLPRDERQAEEWERIKRDWRLKRDKQEEKEDTQVERSAAKPKKGASVLTGHFPSSKTVVSARTAAASKKRPPASPPAAHSPSPPPNRSIAERKDRPPGSKSVPSRSSDTSTRRKPESPAPQRAATTRDLMRDVEEGVLSDGEDDEVLFERGCTQMLLPNPTPSITNQTSRPSRSTTTSGTSSAAKAALPRDNAAPFSSPGLRTSGPLPDVHAGITVSTPRAHIARTQLPSPSASASASRSPSPKPHAVSARPTSPTVKKHARASSQATTQGSTLSTVPDAIDSGPSAAIALVKPVLHRLSSVARTGSVVSVGSATGRDIDGEQRGWETFLHEDARD